MKKSKDSRAIFEVFRKGSFMEGATFTEKLIYWIKNVYLCHLAVPTIITLVAVIFAVTLIGDITSRKPNDIDYVVGGSIFISNENLDDFSDYLASFVKEDSEEISVGSQLLSTKSIIGGNIVNPYDEYTAASIEKITISMANDDVLLFFFDRQYAEWYAKEGAFEPLSGFGIESADECYIRVDKLPAMEKFGFAAEDGIYAAIKIKTSSRMKNERIAKKYENTGKALYGLVYGE